MWPRWRHRQSSRRMWLRCKHRHWLRQLLVERLRPWRTCLLGYHGIRRRSRRWDRRLPWRGLGGRFGSNHRDALLRAGFTRGTVDLRRNFHTLCIRCDRAEASLSLSNHVHRRCCDRAQAILSNHVRRVRAGNFSGIWKARR